MEDSLKKVFNCGIVPVIKLENAEDAVPLCNALLDGGINIAEITFRTEAAADSIRNVSESMPDVFVGAGTVTSVDLAQKAIDAGAKFIISPGFNPRVVEYCQEKEMPIFPGVSSPSDIENALNYGLKVLKFFPAEANGGLKALKAMSAPYSMIRFMPTGGIDASNLLDYLKFDKIIACGGSWMVREDLIKSKNFSEVTRLTKDAVSKMHNFHFAHMAVNSESQDKAKALTELFANTFGLSTRETSAGYFASESIEILNTAGPGEHGHIGIRTTNVERAIAYFERLGIALNYDIVRETNGRRTFIYLKDTFGGFDVHIME